MPNKISNKYILIEFFEKKLNLYFAYITFLGKIEQQEK